MLYPKQQLSGPIPKYHATCDKCGCDIEEGLHEAIEMAAVLLTEKYGWILMDDFESCYCSQTCCDKDDIENIDKRIKEHNDGDERRALN